MCKKIIAFTLCVLTVLSLLVGCTHPSVDGDTVVITVGSSEITVLEYNYLYYSQVQEFCDTYKGYLSQFGLDPSASLKGQACSYREGGGTWADYFMDQADEVFRQVYLFYNAAIRAGKRLQDYNSESTLTSYVLAADEAARAAGKTLDEYLASTYGKGMNETLYREFLTHRLLAAAYCDEVLAALEFEESEFDAVYEEFKDQLISANFRVYSLTEANLPADFSASTEAETDEAVKDLAKSFIDGLTSEEIFLQRAQDYAPEKEKETYADPQTTLAQGITAGNLTNESMKAWLFNEDRKPGDVSYYKTSNNTYTVCYFLSVGRDNTPGTASMRHLLLEVKKNPTKDDPTEEDVLKTINALYAQWKDEGSTVESFTKLVLDNSQDPGSKTTGGLYEDFTKGYMVSEIDTWIFDNRQENDSAVIKTSLGYHIVWFLGYGEPTWRAQCREYLENEAYQNLLVSYEAIDAVSFVEGYRSLVGNEI